MKMKLLDFDAVVVNFERLPIDKIFKIIVRQVDVERFHRFDPVKIGLLHEFPYTVMTPSIRNFIIHILWAQQIA
jgi:hypothetical protein